MPYSSEVRVGVVSGAAPSMDVSLALWELFQTIDGSGRLHDTQVDQEWTSVPVGGGTNTGFSFIRGPDFLSNNNHEISLAAYQTGFPGPMFRSGRMASLPSGSPGNSAGLVDILLVDQLQFPMADINAMIPTPITLPDGNVVTGVSITSAPPSRTLTLVATGPYGATTFTYTLSFTIDPSDDQFVLTNVLAANATDRGSIVFVAGPGGGAQALIDNLFAGLFVGRITRDVIAEIDTSLNRAAAAAGARAASQAGAPDGLPAGVILGARNVAVARNGDLVISPVIGSFGSIIDKFLAASPPGGSRCFIATAALGPAAHEVSVLREFRDTVLLRSHLGRSAITIYEYVSPPIAALIARHSWLRALTRNLIVRPAYWVSMRGLHRNS